MNRYLFCFVWQSSTGVNKCNAIFNCEWKGKFKNSKKFKFKLEIFFYKNSSWTLNWNSVQDMSDDGESLSERQEFEVQALKAIYDNDFEVSLVKVSN